MKTHPLHTSLVLGLAALTANADSNDLGLAACSFEINVDQPWQQILPGQDFAAKDGRPENVPGNKWLINNESGQVLAAKLNARAEAGQKLLFDYEHQTLLTNENGQKAPASGRGQKFEWREGQGLFAQLKFTPVAKKHVDNGEYEFFSPVVMYDKATGQVLDLHSVALTNDPAVLGMQAVAALKQISNPPAKDTTMNPILAAMLKALGLTIDESKELDQAALTALLDSDAAKTGMAALTAKLTEHGTQTTEIAALKANAATAVDPAKYVPVATYDAVLTEMAALKANNESLTVEQTIEQAQKDGKFIASGEIEYLKSLGNTDIAALKSTLDGRPTVGAFTGKQTAEQKPDAQDNTGVAALTTDHKLVADQLGISHDDYAKQLATEA